MSNTLWTQVPGYVYVYVCVFLQILDVLSGKTRHPVDSTTFTTFVPREQWDQKPLLVRCSSQSKSVIQSRHVRAIMTYAVCATDQALQDHTIDCARIALAHIALLVFVHVSVCVPSHVCVCVLCHRTLT